MFLDTSSGLVNLTCVIETLEPPQSVAWYHNNTKVSSTLRQRLRILTDVGIQVSAYQSGVSLLVDKSEVTVVSLLLQSVTTSHSGQYECRPDNAPPANIKLHVIKGNLELQ